MSVIGYTEQRILESHIAFQDITEVVLEPEMYREFLLEMSNMPVANSVKIPFNTSFGIRKPIYFNSMTGPIEIKVSKNNRQDPNNILKEIL